MGILLFRDHLVKLSGGQVFRGFQAIQYTEMFFAILVYGHSVTQCRHGVPCSDGNDSNLERLDGLFFLCGHRPQAVGGAFEVFDQ